MSNVRIIQLNVKPQIYIFLVRGFTALDLPAKGSASEPMFLAIGMVCGLLHLTNSSTEINESMYELYILLSLI